MRAKVPAGTTSYAQPIFVTNSSAGGGLGSLVYNTSGLVGEYRREGSSSWTSISLSAGTLGTWSSGGWIGDGSCTGAYEVGIPDAALATGKRWLAVRYYGAANMSPVLIYIELDAVNYQSSTAFMTGVNSLAPPTNWNLTSIDASGRMDVGKILGIASAGTAGYMAPDWGHVNAPTSTVNLSGTSISTSQIVASVSGAVGSVSGNVSGSVASVSGAVGSVTGSVGSVVGNVGGNVSGNVVGTVGYVLNAPFKINTANGFSIFPVSSTDNKTPFTAGGISVTRSIAGGAQTAITGSLTQVGSTNEYYLSGAAADFNGTSISFIFTATGMNSVYITVNTQP